PPHNPRTRLTPAHNNRRARHRKLVRIALPPGEAISVLLSDWFEDPYRRDTTCPSRFGRQRGPFQQLSDTTSPLQNNPAEPISRRNKQIQENIAPLRLPFQRLTGTT